MTLSILNANKDCYLSYSAEINKKTGEINQSELYDGIKIHNTSESIVVRLFRYQDKRAITMYWDVYDWTLTEEEFNRMFGVGALVSFTSILLHYKKVPQEWMWKIKKFCGFVESIVNTSKETFKEVNDDEQV